MATTKKERVAYSTRGLHRELRDKMRMTATYSGQTIEWVMNEALRRGFSGDEPGLYAEALSIWRDRKKEQAG